MHSHSNLLPSTASVWLPGMITAANLESMKWDVAYANGDSDRMCHRCVRPFVPFAIGETVRYSDGKIESQVVDARIIGIDNEAWLCDIELHDTNEILRKIHFASLHRSITDRYVYKKGSHALAKRGPKTVSVIVLSVNANGTLTVGSADGLTGVVNGTQLKPHLTWYGEYVSQ